MVTWNQFDLLVRYSIKLTKEGIDHLDEISKPELNFPIHFLKRQEMWLTQVQT